MMDASRSRVVEIGEQLVLDFDDNSKNTPANVTFNANWWDLFFIYNGVDISQ